MLQVQLIREHKEFYLEALTKRGVDAAEIFDRVLALDEKRRATQTALDETLANPILFQKKLVCFLKTVSLKRQRFSKKKPLNSRSALKRYKKK